MPDSDRARRGKAALVAALTSLGLLAAAASASGAVRFASPSGSPSATCPQADPCGIVEAVNEAAAGDEVIVLPGTYSISDQLNLEHAGMNVHGQAGQPRPVIVTSGFTGVSVGNLFARASDLEIVHSGANVGLAVDGLAERMVVRSKDSQACFARGTLRDSVCHAIGLSPGLAVSGSAAPLLRNVTAVSTEGVGMAAGALGMNTIAIDGKSVIARGSIVSGSQPDVSAFADTDATVSIEFDHSNYATTDTDGDGTKSITPAGSGTNQMAAPLFVNAAAGNFHQASGSPTIDAGAVDGSSGALDFDRHPRTLGAAPDIGADEFATFELGKVKRNKRKGIAKLKVKVPAAGTAELAKTKKVKRASKDANGAGTVKLKIRPRGRTKRKLNEAGETKPVVKAKVKAKVTYTPDVGPPVTKKKRVRLIKRA